MPLPHALASPFPYPILVLFFPRRINVYRDETVDTRHIENSTLNNYSKMIACVSQLIFPDFILISLQ